MKWFKSLPVWGQVLLGLGSIAFLCFACFIFSVIFSEAPEVSQEDLVLTAMAQIEASEAANADPTDTPFLTDTPLPTATPTPEPFTCRNVEREKSQLTDLQWENRAGELIGTEIVFSGAVTEVYEDGRIQIEDNYCKGFFTIVILYGVDVNTALSFNKGDTVTGKGTLRETGTFISLYVHINVDVIQ